MLGHICTDINVVCLLVRPCSCCADTAGSSYGPVCSHDQDVISGALQVNAQPFIKQQRMCVLSRPMQLCLLNTCGVIAFLHLEGKHAQCWWTLVAQVAELSKLCSACQITSIIMLSSNLCLESC